MEAQTNEKNHRLHKQILSELKDFSSIPFAVRFSIYRSRCLESLMVNRYLDEDEKFYKTAEVTLRFFENMQKQGPWIHDLSEIEKKIALDYYIGD